MKYVTAPPFILHLYNMWLWRITITSSREILRLYHRIRLHSCRECNLRRYQIVINEYLKRCQRESSRRGECGSSRLLRFNKWKWALWSYFWSRPPGAARGDDPILSGRKSYLAAVFPPRRGSSGLQVVRRHHECKYPADGCLLPRRLIHFGSISDSPVQ